MRERARGGGRENGTEGSSIYMYYVHARVVSYCYWWRILHIYILFYIIINLILYARRNRFYFSPRTSTEYIMYLYRYMCVCTYYYNKINNILRSSVFFFFKTKTKNCLTLPLLYISRRISSMSQEAAAGLPTHEQ